MTSPKVVPLAAPSASKTIHLDVNASHARFYADWRHLDAFKSLRPLERVILQDLLMDYSRLTGNEARLTATGIMERYSVGRLKAKRAIANLEERGWIERIRLGPGPTGQLGGVYRLLCICAKGRRTSGPYMTWKR